MQAPTSTAVQPLSTDDQAPPLPLKPPPEKPPPPSPPVRHYKQHPILGMQVLVWTVPFLLCAVLLICVAQYEFTADDANSLEGFSLTKMVHTPSYIMCMSNCVDLGSMCAAVRYSDISDVCKITAENITRENSAILGLFKDKLQKAFTDEIMIHRNPCASNPCNNNGWCVTVNEDQYKCICKVGSGYTGRNCDVSDPVTTDVWADWSSWSDCGTTSGTGYRERRRYCIHEPNNTTFKQRYCIGQAVQFIRCHVVIEVVNAERLYGSDSIGNGTLRVFIEWLGQWIDVIGMEGWGFQVAVVACRHLGFTSANSTWSGKILSLGMEVGCVLKCSGNELSLYECESTLIRDEINTFTGITCTNDEWDSWSPWSQCTCGFRNRTRSCVGATCEGSSYQQLHCLKYVDATDLTHGDGVVASQISNYYGYLALLALDGNSNPDFSGTPHCSHTLESQDAWWKVELARIYTITNVIITNRLDFRERIDGAVVLISDQAEVFGEQCGDQINFAANSYSVTIPFDCCLSGQYVSIVLKGRKNFLTLCEVKVYGH
uniref:Uncharacterized protein LOC102807576 n=1 Tax=Saccoglossus kowalevskii TaxID=10224 RepID=A0ABM0MJA7_SACKO|nr:PREDICTED: uncharacterized protein LOC102807576 [Saccoglossus kowalevskii]